MGSRGFLSANGQLDAAEEIERRVCLLVRSKFGPEDERTFTMFRNLAVIFYKQGEYDKVEELNRRVLNRRTKILRAEHIDTLTSLNSLAIVLQRREKYKEAEEMHRSSASDLRTFTRARASRDAHELEQPRIWTWRSGQVRRCRDHQPARASNEGEAARIKSPRYA
jgi:hypothetical protein